ncbi:ABC transporter permease [Inquilinus sp.]|jgi:peptide/nickel transport system permease protein|uniref:ABC transporter permease n=1 Tax=Inquilinus sp. TaxID=1932117 RepID=UPI003783FCE4
MSTQADTPTTVALPKRRIRANAAIGGLIIGLLVATALLSAVWTPYDPLKIDILSRFKAPSAAHWLGTDEFGRDVLSRAMSGAATSAWISLLTVATAVTGGTLIGVLTGYMRGWVDRIIMVFNDAILAFPGILLALGIMAILGANKYGIILALGLAYMPSVVRVVRGTVLSIRGREYVEASQIMGNSEIFTMARHVLPNCIAPLTVLATSMFGWVLLSESALSFLGLGVPPPAATWGNMLAAARPYIGTAPWLGIFPGLCISLTLLGINLFGDAIRDRLDPRMQR